MSASTVRLALADAEDAAVAFSALIADVCERIAVAGSIRRRSPHVGDIELVCSPKTESMPQVNLFDEAAWSIDVDCLADRLDALVATGTVARRRRRDGRFVWGPSAKLLTYGGVNVDLFSPEPERFGWIYLLRTGPAAFSNALVTPVDTRTKSGRAGLMPLRYASRDGWIVERMSGQRIVTPHESDVFELFGLAYVEPWDRA